MRHTLHTIFAPMLALALVAAPALAADPTPKPKSSQQDRMKACNADAKTQKLKGDERKAFMSQCLKGK